MSQEQTILFLYGSLKRGLENHPLVAAQQYVGEAVTVRGYRIIHLGRYPGLIRDTASGLAVRGELWAVSPSCLAELDDFEEADGLWKRGPVDVPSWEGVEAYFWVGTVPPGAMSGEEWPMPEDREQSTKVSRTVL